MKIPDPNSNRKRGRAFMCDPVCAQPFGHNVVGLKYFSDAVRTHFSEVLLLASHLLPESVRLEYGFVGAFDFYYHRQIDLGQPHRRPGAPRMARGQVLDVERRAAVEDFSNLFNKYGPNRNDAIIFPSVDYYGAIGTFTALENIAPSDAPAVYLRFIGVMENATSTGAPGLPLLLRQIEKLTLAGYAIHLCAETPRYADYLAREIGTPVTVVPYPPHGNADRSRSASMVGRDGTDKEEKPSRPFIVTCPGSSRLDKGYLSLGEIFSKTRALDTDLQIRFVTQGLPIHEALNHSRYTNQLYAIPGVHLLPSVLSEQQINDTYERTDLVLLPYDRSIYQYRGSAVFMECLARNVPVVALAGPAFCEQISYYGAGVVVNNIDEMVAEIIKHSEKRPTTTRIQLAQARHRYNIDASHAISSWLNP